MASLAQLHWPDEKHCSGNQLHCVTLYLNLLCSTINVLWALDTMGKSRQTDYHRQTLHPGEILLADKNL